MSTGYYLKFRSGDIVTLTTAYDNVSKWAAEIDVDFDNVVDGSYTLAFGKNFSRGRHGIRYTVSGGVVTLIGALSDVDASGALVDFATPVVVSGLTNIKLTGDYDANKRLIVEVNGNVELDSTGLFSTKLYITRLFEFTNQDVDIYRFRLFDGTGTLVLDYDPTLSGGTGSTLSDAVGTNHATLVNFPTDDTQWGSYTINDAPTITLTSPASITITQGDVWDNSVITYTASDPEDGVITGSVVLNDSAVDANTVGSYQVTLNVVDSQSLAAPEVIVTVNVQAADAPTVSVVGSYKPGETITFTPANIVANAATLTDKQGNVLVLTGVTSTTGAISDFITGVTAGVLFGDCTLEITDGVKTAQTIVTIDPPAGYSFVDVGATPNLTSTGIAYNWGNPPSQGDQVIYPSTLTVDSDLNVSGNAGSYACYAALSAGPVFEAFTVMLAEEGAQLDTTKPVITLTTGTDTINAGDAWVDAGATAADNIDGDLTSSIVVTGSVNNAVPGTYTIYYNVTDAAGNIADQVARTVTVNAVPVAPILASTMALSGYVGQSYQRQLTESGDPATSWTITGGADAASYTLNNSGFLQRIAPNDTEESEVITVTATNATGTSGVMTITVNYTIFIQIETTVIKDAVQSAITNATRAI